MRACILMLLLSASAHAELRGRLWNGDQPAARAAILIDEGTAATPPRSAQLDEVWLSFVPKIQVAPPGSTVAFTARDADSHTVHAWYGKETLFNRASVPHGPTQHAILERPGVVTVTCDLHKEMRAWVVVSTAAFSAVSDTDGRFAVAAPAGRHHVKVWRPGDVEPIDLGELELKDNLELRAPAIAEAPVAAPAREVAPIEPPARLPGWMTRMSTRKSWPSGNLAYVLSVAGAPVGFALAWALFWWSKRRGGSVAIGVLLGCALAFGFGASSALGLSPAVATGLGFGAFMGTIIGAANRIA